MNLRSSVSLFLFLMLSMMAQPLFGWAEAGHAIIAYLAYKQLPESKQRLLDDLIKQHPNWDKDFTPPDDLPTNVEKTKWVLGRIGYWPDVARDYEEYNRPTWHFQLGVALTLGNVDGLPIPEEPGPLPPDATMETQELYVLQALELCRRELANHENDPAARAIAMCWITHLVADLHLPCHSGSLYAESVFEEEDGDRGANRIEIGEQRLHAYWDQLLGDLYEKGDVNRRIYELTNDPALVERGVQAKSQMDTKVWLLESRSVAVQFLYTAEVQQAIRDAIEAKKSKLKPIRLSEDYGRQAGRVAQVRAMEAAARLSVLLDESL